MSTFTFIPSMSTNEIYYNDNTSICLTDVVDGKAEADHTHTGFAPESHSHAEYAEVAHEHSGYAAIVHVHDGYADADHTHAGFAVENHEHDGYASSTHTHTASEVGAATASHGHSEYADANHSHSGYATLGHTHTPAGIGAADANHSHSGYASSSHDHDGDYLPATGDVNVDGVLRVENQQAFYYNTSSNAQTIGTNNASGGTTIACGSSATVGVNGALVKTPTLVPRANDSFYCGNANFRWKGIYSISAVNVSSDERMKRDINPMDSEELADFIDRLKVVSYNYKSDDADEKARIGLIAQDVQNAGAKMSEFFVTEDETGTLGIKPADFVFPLIAAVQYLSDRVEALEAIVAEK